MTSLEWELLECDLGYRSSDNNPDWTISYQKLMYKGVHDTRKQGRQCAAVRARHETIQSRLKDFGVLFQVFRNGYEKHGECFFAVAVLVQLGLRENPHWQTDYNVVYQHYSKPPRNFTVTFESSSEEEDDNSDSSASEDDHNNHDVEDDGDNSVQLLFQQAWI